MTENAELLGVDICDVDYVFISHGHSDHAGGLRHFLEHNQKAKVIVSPDAISGRFFSKRGNLHSITTEWPEIATIIFLVAFTDFLPFISKHGIDLTNMPQHLSGHTLTLFGN